MSWCLESADIIKHARELDPDASSSDSTSASSSSSDSDESSDDDKKRKKRKKNKKKRKRKKDSSSSEDQDESSSDSSEGWFDKVKKLLHIAADSDEIDRKMSRVEKYKKKIEKKVAMGVLSLF